MDWLYGLIGVAFLGLLGVVWNQMNEKMREHKEACDKDIEALWLQIGRDSNSGMRKSVHNAVPMGAHIDLERRVDKLERETQ